MGVFIVPSPNELERIEIDEFEMHLKKFFFVCALI